MKIIAIIISSGSGTRLWPLSRRQYPKQFLPIIGEYLGEDDILRFEDIYGRID